ncbi:hypothetical protein BYT27DRAFT_7202794 [Phlegmacium glaucopus]|nr:hypothetical protein BYT27DRAFT_7202794 [Phlegmacium glaucopus]
MDYMPPQFPTLPTESTDIFSLSDQVLSDRLEFIEEIGFGNWGSVWLCRPKPATTEDGVVRPLGQKIAVKLVHRAKTSTTAARVRSLWNEMKIVRSFKSDPHPSIIPFHSFIITPSYALITMSYLPTLVPVEVEELKAREWFRFLLSGVEFLHKRGVVHNDIKPANILLSHKNIPVLVDFGFAEKYDMTSDTAFHSNLSYGTPEYLSPERARGLPHDTRKSDVWSLGVTFFEILVGRTPFEHSDGEQFNSSEDLEKYWARTLRGKWVGAWQISKEIEKLLRRMISPNADLRCTAMQAIADPYWQMPRKESTPGHKRSSSYTSSIVFEKDMAKLMNLTPSSWKSKENAKIATPPGLDCAHEDSKDDDLFGSKRTTLAKSKSQPKVAGTKVPPRKRVPVPPIMDLSPIKASPPTSPFSDASAKENILSFNRLASVAISVNKKKNIPNNENRDENNVNVNPHTNNNTNANSRRPFGTVSTRGNIPRPVSALVGKPSGNSRGGKALKVLGESQNIDKEQTKGKESTNVKDRVKEWEREKERLREMTRLEEMERERDDLYEKKKKEKVKEKAKKVKIVDSEEKKGKENSEEKDEEAEKERENGSEKEIDKETPSAKEDVSPPALKTVDPANDWEWNKENVDFSVTSPIFSVFRSIPPLTRVTNVMSDTPLSTRINKEMNKNIFKHSIKASIDKTVQLYKSSTLGQVTSGRSTPARGLSFDVTRPQEPKVSTKDGKEAWATDADGSLPEISPLPVIKNAAESERIAADSRMDRMTIWMRNVEKVVEDAKQNFASSSSPQDLPLPALPLPLARNASQNRSSRLPRRVLAASQIFQADENGNVSPMDQTMISTANSMYLTANDTSRGSISPSPADASIEPKSPSRTQAKSHLQIPEIHTPSRQRRATVSTRSPEPTEQVFGIEGSPSKRKEKSKSYGNLFQMHIAPISLLEAELSKTPPPAPTLRLSQVLDRNLFIAPLLTSRDDLLDSQSISFDQVRETSLDELTSSPCLVEPYPQRIRGSQEVPIPDTPSRHRIEGVYDRFLMATSGVKRLGKGYQSDNVGPVCSNTVGAGVSVNKGRHFYSSRKPMPPPVSSADQYRAASVDELGIITYEENHSDTPNSKDDSNTTVARVRKAIKLMVPKAAGSRRLSRIG